MANSAPESEFDLKKRLVGAFILIGFGVVILPALLGGEDPQLNRNQTHPASLDSKVFVSKITPIGGATPKLPQAEKQDQAQLAQPAAAAQTKNSKAESSSQPQATAQVEAKVEATNQGEPGWVVRIGTFAKEGNAERVMKRLQQAGFEPSTTKISTDSGAATRVWIGPYAQRVEAARMRKRVNQVTGGEAYIAAYP